MDLWIPPIKLVHESLCELPLGGDVTMSQRHESMMPPLVCLTLQVWVAKIMAYVSVIWLRL
jgi:hypothetical protein